MKHTKNAITCLMAGVVLTLAAATTAGAATALNGQIVLRPLTPGDVGKYALPATTEASPGLPTTGIGSPAYLELEINSAIDPATIVSVTWVLTNRPAFSAASLTNSPLGTNVPIYEMSARSSYQVAGRKLLRPDLVGQYTVVATIVTTDSGSATVSKTITAGTYMGVATCALCHSGSVAAEDKYTPWKSTGHAHIFTDGINGTLGFYRASCLPCHTVGYNANTNSIVNPINGGFDDVAKQFGWTFPTVLAPTNWAYMQAVYPQVANLANIQCENCHGPGSQHAYGLGGTSTNRLISKTLATGDCNQCHDAPTHHIKGTEWYNSKHAVMGSHTSSSCGRCHTAQGFINFVNGAPAVSTPYEVITCAACHEPHSATNAHQLRTVADVPLMDNKTVVTEGGLGKICMNCHISRRDATNYVETSSISSGFGPHHGPQTDMYVGANAITYGKDIPSSAHREVVEDSCAQCHMQDAEGSPALLNAGGHTFKMKWDSGTNVVEMTEACVQCHGEVEGFDFKRQDYDGNGVVEGVQTEVKGLLDKLGRMLPPIGDPTVTTGSSYTRQQARAAYNYKFVLEDGSYGIHNLSYAVGLLKASIADLSGDANNDGIADWWQQQYFGADWANNPNAARTATPAGDGIPNWLKYLLGLDPLVAGVVVPGGVVWANGKQVGGGTNTIQIYTAAEVSFNTESNKTYQIQAASAVSSGWENVGLPIPGTGNAISYVTPTRQNLQQFYRVYSY